MVLLFFPRNQVLVDPKYSPIFQFKAEHSQVPSSSYEPNDWNWILMCHKGQIKLDTLINSTKTED